MGEYRYIEMWDFCVDAPTLKVIAETGYVATDAAAVDLTREQAVIKLGEGVVAQLEAEADELMTGLNMEQKDQPFDFWCKRLVRLTDISITIEEARAIVKTKLQAHADSVAQARGRRRSKLLRKHPVGRIVDTEHANGIIGSYLRHTHSNYDAMLAEGRRKRRVDPLLDVREYARDHRSRVASNKLENDPENGDSK